MPWSDRVICPVKVLQMSTNASADGNTVTPSTPSSYSLSHVSTSGPSIRSSNVSSEEINALKESIFILQQGAEYRPDSSPHFSYAFRKWNCRAYRFVQSRWFRLLGIIICTIQMSLCFLEPSSLSLQSRTNKPILSLHECLVIETFCTLMHIFALYLCYQGLGGHIRSYMKWYWQVSIFCLISMALTYFFPISICRIYRFFRPLFPLIYWSTARVWNLIIAETFKKTLKVILLGTLLITSTFSALIYSFYNPYSIEKNASLKAGLDKITQFKSMPRTMIHMFLYAADANYRFVLSLRYAYNIFYSVLKYIARIWAAIYEQDKWHCIAWILLILIMHQLLQNVLLSVTIDKFKDIENAMVHGEIDRLKQRISQSFYIVAAQNTNQTVTKKQMKYIYNKFNYLQSSSYSKPTHFEIFWVYCNNQENNEEIQEEQFKSFCLIWLCTMHLRKKYGTEHDFVKSLFEYKATTNLSYSEIFFCAFSIIQCSLILTRMYFRIDHPKHSATQWIVYFVKFSHIVWILELFFRVYAYGLMQYLKSSHLFNGIITIMVNGLTLYNLICCGYGLMSHNNRHDFWTILRIGYVILVFAGQSVEFSHVLRASSLAIRQAMAFIFVSLLFQIFLALIGMELFANMPEFIDPNHGPEHRQVYAWQKLFNFDTFVGAMNMVNIIYTENGFNWMFYDGEQAGFVKCSSFLREYGYWIVCAYFIIGYVLECWLISQLLTGIFLDVYGFYIENWVDHPELTEMRNEIQVKLQKCADIIEPNVYTVEFWFPKISSRKTRGIEQLLTIR